MCFVMNASPFGFECFVIWVQEFTTARRYAKQRQEYVRIICSLFIVHLHLLLQSPLFYPIVLLFGT